jgi:hypothetical protein
MVLATLSSIITSFYLHLPRLRTLRILNIPSASVLKRIAQSVSLRINPKRKKSIHLYIITQPRKSYYKSGGRVNPMICLLNLQRAVMVKHKSITARYETRLERFDNVLSRKSQSFNFFLK